MRLVPTGAAGAAGAAGVAGKQYADDHAVTSTTSKDRHDAHDVAAAGARQHDKTRGKMHDTNYDSTSRAAPAGQTGYDTTSMSQGGNYGTTAGGQQGTQHLSGTQYSNTGGADQFAASTGGQDNRGLAAGAAAGVGIIRRDFGVLFTVFECCHPKLAPPSSHSCFLLGSFCSVWCRPRKAL